MASHLLYYENAGEKRIREAQERGDFEDLAGAGKPFDLGDLNDPDRWVKRSAKGERLDLGGALPGALGLLKEASGYPASPADVRREEHVREILDDFNPRVLADRRRPALGKLPPMIAKTVDVDELVGQWALLRERIAAEARARAAEMELARQADEAARRLAHRRQAWWRRVARRR